MRRVIHHVNMLMLILCRQQMMNRVINHIKYTLAQDCPVVLAEPVLGKCFEFANTPSSFADSILRIFDMAVQELRVRNISSSFDVCFVHLTIYETQKL